MRVTIPRRFNGPPDSGNGGYSCGLLARSVDGPAEVSLRRPPPLERALHIERRDGDELVLLDGDEVVAEGGPSVVDDPPHGAVSLAEAEAGPEHFPYSRWHPFPTCFVCGPEREEGDGLRLFPGRVGDGELCATTWTPDESLAPDGAPLPTELIWAALDCPTSVPVANPPEEGATQRPVVLARLAARIPGPVVVGLHHVVTSWPVEFDGRKRFSGSAIYTEDGELRAVSRALWIELRDG